LSRARQPFYYIGDQQFTVGEIRHYLPEFSENRYLVSQGLTVMLETPLEYGGALDPYIIWYNGKNKIGEGFASAGTARMLWAAPLRSGFHAIRAELFPFGPQAGLQGKIKEFSLPVSPKNERKTAAGTESGGYLYRYLFAGDLLDAETGAGLDPVQISGLPLAWYPAEQVYGLGLREGDIYETPGYSLDLSGEELGELTLFIRALALEDGGIFTASLGSALKIGLSLNEEVLVLDLEGQGQTSRISAAARKSGWDPAFTGVLVTVKFERTRVSACMVPADSPAGAVLQESEASEDAVQAAQEEAPLSGRAEIALTGPVTGKLRSRIGREASKAPVMEAMETAVWAPDTVSTPPSSDYFSEPSPASALPVLVVDDFTAVFRRYRREVEIIEKEEALEGAEMGERAEIPENPEKVENTAGADKIEKTVDGAAEEEAADSGDSEPDGLSFSGLPG
jgi:hypothetical protein